MSVKALTQQTPLQPKLPIPSRLCNALEAEEEKTVGTHLHALYRAGTRANARWLQGSS